jgi:hypothetical protein
MRPRSFALLVCALTGCAASPEWGWRRADGRSAQNDPVLMKHFESDRGACVADSQQPGLTDAAGERGHAATDIVQDCMAHKGYVMVPRTAHDDTGPRLGM